MIRKINAWQSDDDRRWPEAMQAYQNYIDAHKALLPTALFDFVDSYTLHDGCFFHIHQISAVPTKKDVLLTIKAPKNGWLCDCDNLLLVIHFVEVQGRIQTEIPSSYIAYYDVEVMGDNSFKMSFALNDGKTWSIKFMDFGFYVHNYRK